MAMIAQPESSLSSGRLENRNEPRTVALNPSRMKISENVPTNSTLRPSTRRSTRTASARPGSAPDTVARYPGTSGRQHGEMNDTTPAANASSRLGLLAMAARRTLRT